MTRRKSRAEVEIEEQLATLDPSSVRYQVLEAARDFKAAWIELGRRLTVAREDEGWKAWGYSSFEAYCRRELRLRRDTANKLTRSYSFLRDHEPTALEECSTRELPPLDVVDLLSRAREKAKLTDQQLDEIREEVFDPQAGPTTRSQVVKRFREIDPDAFRKAPAEPKAAAKVSVRPDVRKALLLAERLQALLEAQEGISGKALDGVRLSVSELRGLAQHPVEEAV